MTFNFDLISDLNLEKNEEIDLRGKQTSIFCIVSGNVSRDRNTLVSALEHICDCYRAVFYIDGPLDHFGHESDIEASYSDLELKLKHLKNFTFLHNRVIVLDEYAIVGTNGWASMDMNPEYDYWQTEEWCSSNGITSDFFENANLNAISDAKYLSSTIETLQMHNNVQKIIVVSATIPLYELVKHDINLNKTPKINTKGNSFLSCCLSEDLEDKIRIWCFGSYSHQIDSDSLNVRWICNPATQLNEGVFYPLKVSV
jgi:hypothetical protein